MQYVENLSDRQAAEAVRSRIDWKYMLGLSLEDPGFDFSVLSEFRQRLLQGEAETLLLEKLLELCEALGFLKGKKKQINVGRTLTLYPQEPYEAQLEARKRQQTEEFKELY